VFRLSPAAPFAFGGIGMFLAVYAILPTPACPLYAAPAHETEKRGGPVHSVKAIVPILSTIPMPFCKQGAVRVAKLFASKGQNWHFHGPDA
jgi:hypothetical protein